jgi:hypothetical protein
MAQRSHIKSDACVILRELKIPRGENFFVLPSSKVSELLDVADEYKYRKPKSASGSRGRYFHAYLQRLCNR